jgi:hypothetical protein
VTGRSSPSGSDRDDGSSTQARMVPTTHLTFDLPVGSTAGRLAARPRASHHLNKLGPNTLPPISDDDLRRCLEDEGLNYQETAKELGCDRQRIVRRAKKLGIQLQSRLNAAKSIQSQSGDLGIIVNQDVDMSRTYATHWSLSEEQQVRDLWARGTNDKEISALLGRTMLAVSSKREELGFRSRERPAKVNICRKCNLYSKTKCFGNAEKACGNCILRGYKSCNYLSADGGSVTTVFIIEGTSRFSAGEFWYPDDSSCSTCKPLGRRCFRPNPDGPYTYCMLHTPPSVHSCVVHVSPTLCRRYDTRHFTYSESDDRESCSVTRLDHDASVQLAEARKEKQAIQTALSRSKVRTVAYTSDPGDSSDESDIDVDELITDSVIKSRATLQSFAANTEAHMAALWDEDAFVAEMEAVELTAMNVFNVTVDHAYAPLPQTRRQALAGLEAFEWNAAIELEYDSMISNDTWEPAVLPEGRKALTVRWVFKRKLGPDNKVVRYKARIVVRGFQQIEGFDYTETFAGVVKDDSTRLLFAIAAALGWHVHQMDVETAFLNSELQEDIYVHAPEGYSHHGRILRLRRALYGLKQAPRYWYKKFRSWLTTAGFKAVPQDECVFISAERRIIISLYVDDTNIFGPDLTLIAAFKAEISQAFKMTDSGPAAWYLGMQIDQSAEGISMHQAAYANQIISQHGFDSAVPAHTPLVPRLKLDKQEGQAVDSVRKSYLSKTGALNWLAVKTRPDLAFPTSYVSRFNSNPGSEHDDAVSHIFRYVLGTPSMGLHYSRQNDNEPLILRGYVDSDWAGEKSSSLSTTGYVFTLAGSPVAWSSQRQKNVATSSTHAEYFAASEAAKQAYWLCGWMNEIAVLDSRIMQGVVPLHIDNESAVKLTKNPESHARTRHIDIRYHYIRELVEDGTIETIWIPGTENPADMFTKPLAAPPIEMICKKLGLGLSHELDTTK